MAMNNWSSRRVAHLLTVWALASPGPIAAQATQMLPSPLSLADVIRMASERRDEIQAARARIRAGEARPDIVSALEDPMFSSSLDRLPFMLGGADYSFTLEQQIPLSGIRGHRRASALADVDRLRAEANRTTLDVGIQAVNAFLMLQERRRTETLVSEQLAFARDVVSATNARYAGGTAPQSDVLRAEVEVARLEALARSLISDVRGAEAMLNASLALDADSPVPPLAFLAFAQPSPPWPAIKAALTSRPELVAGRAEVVRAGADVEVMRDMFRPMATVRSGPAYTMAPGARGARGRGRTWCPSDVRRCVVNVCNQSGRAALHLRDAISRRSDMEKDVVCGMQVDSAKAAGSSQWNGKTY